MFSGVVIALGKAFLYVDHLSNRINIVTFVSRVVGTTATVGKDVTSGQVHSFGLEEEVTELMTMQEAKLVDLVDSVIQ